MVASAQNSGLRARACAALALLALASAALVSIALRAPDHPPASPGAPVATYADRAANSRWDYGGGPEQTRYSALTQINRSNVSQLAVAWKYDSGETGGLQTQPIVVDGVLYACTPTHKTFALDAATGRVLWTFDARIVGRGPNRGVTYWADGDDKRIFAPIDQYVYALEARTGHPIPAFGDNGRIDLRQHLDRDPQQQNVRLTTPGIIYKNLLIVGGRVAESLPASPGHVRAYDTKTGILRWIFHTIPHPGETGYETWSKQSWRYNGGTNNWAGMAVDQARGIVFVPTGSAADDFYGANRIGDDLFSNTLLALDANTGKRIWHFQVVRHDLNDRDLPSPPSLVTLQQDGRTIEAVAQTTKHGYVFVFDRLSGTPIFPIEYRRVATSDVAGEVASDTQPFPLKPRPFARQALTEDMLTTRTPAAHQWALEQFRTFRNVGVFAPFALGKPTVVFPGFDGGAEWGGSAFDPETGVLYVNANDLAWTGALAPTPLGEDGRALYQRHCAACHRDDRTGAPPQMPSLIGLGGRRPRPAIADIIRKGAGRMPGFPTLGDEAISAIVEYALTGKSVPASDPTRPSPSSPEFLKYRFAGYKKFLDPDGYPAVAPPWGTLSAIDLNTGEYGWQIPLGEYPELAANGMKPTGTENYGGPIVTAGGLVFIGATNYDNKLRAFDKTTGALLWQTVLPFAGNATPATYEANGRQFVVIAAGGGKTEGASGGVYVAFALPAPPK